MQLLTLDGYKDITVIDIGSELIAYEVGTGNIIINTLLEKEEFSNEENEYYQINSNWILNQNQSIWVERSGQISVVHVKDLQVGDIIFNDDDQDVEITQIDTYEAETWWRLSVSGDHSYIADGLTLHNASRYWVGGGSSANWNATANTNWGSTSGTQDNSSVPTSVDDVTFDGAGTAGNSNSTISATITIKSLNITTSYTSTMTHNAVLTIAGNWTMNNTHTIAGTSSITISATSTITSNGQTWPNNLDFNGVSNVKTLSGNFTINGSIVFTGGTQTFNATSSETFSCKGLNMTFSACSGTVKIILTGGTWSGASYLTHDLDFDGDSTVSGTVYYAVSSKTMTYVSGTITTIGSTLHARPCVLNTNGITWNNFEHGGGTITLTSNFTCTGITTTLGDVGNCILNKTASETWSTNGLNCQRLIIGTAEIILTGGTWSATSSSNAVGNNLTFNGSSTVSGNVYYLSGVLKYTSGTITTTGSTLNITGACTLNTNGITWNNVTFTANGTTTLTSSFSCTGTTTINAALSPAINKTASETWSTNGIVMPATGSLSGTVELVLTGGSWTSAGSFIFTDLSFAGNVTVSGTVYYSSKILKYTFGTITTTGSTLRIGGNVTFNTDGMAWNNLTIADNGTYTVASNFLCDGVFTVLGPLGSYALNRTASQTFVVNGGINVSGNGTSGTAEITLKGGTWIGSNSVGHSLILDGNITISGTVLHGGSSLKYISGTITTTGSTLNLGGTKTIDTNGVTWNNVSITNNGTYTITSNFLCNGIFSMPGALGAFALNRSASETFIVNGGISLTGNGTSGTVEITLRGGTWVGSNGLGNNLILDGNITISGTVAFTAQSIKYLSGTITTTGTTLNFSGTNNRTIDTNGVTWNNVSFLGNGTYTVGSNFLCTGLFTVGVLGAFTFNRTSSSIFRTNGGMSVSTTCSGTAEITLGGGTWSGTAIVTNNLIIDGNVTIAASSGNYTTGTISGTSGTVTGTLNAIGACTFNCVGVNWGTISFAAAATYTVNSLLTASVIQPNISGVTFAGTSGWTCGTLLNASTSSATISLKDGNTYTINNLFNCYQSRIGSPVLFTSSHATNVAYLVMPNNGNNICNVLASFTRINASGGRTINTFGGTITSCVNVNQYYDYRPVAI